MSEYRGCRIIKQLLLWSNIATCVSLQRLLDYQVACGKVFYGGCPSDYGRIIEHIGLQRCQITEVSVYMLK